MLQLGLDPKLWRREQPNKINQRAALSRALLVTSALSIISLSSVRVNASQKKIPQQVSSLLLFSRSRTAKRSRGENKTFSYLSQIFHSPFARMSA